MTADQDIAYRRALGAFATGVALITAPTPQGRWGIVVNSFTSVSLRPRLILWCLGDSSDRYAQFAGAERWTVNVLAAAQQPVAAQFARQGAGAGADLEMAPLGDSERLVGARLALACRTHERRMLGDHLVIVGAVLAFAAEDGPALTYFRGRFGRADLEA